MDKNNSFTLDSIGKFALRLEIFTTGLNKYGLEIGFSSEEIAELTGSVGGFRQKDYEQTEESADVAEVDTRIGMKCQETLKDLYACRKLLRGESVFAAENAKEYIAERFLLNEKVPRRRGEIIELAENMVSAFDSFPAELPEVVLPGVPFEKLRASLTSLKNALEPASRERAEKKAAIAKVKTLRAEGNQILRRVFLRAISYWGNDDPRLFELGFVPKSSIWTKKKKPKEPPE
jgi:hypothetical protein